MWEGIGAVIGRAKSGSGSGAAPFGKDVCGTGEEGERPPGCYAMEILELFNNDICCGRVFLHKKWTAPSITECAVRGGTNRSD